MFATQITAQIRNINGLTRIIDITGDITAKGETVLMDAYDQASAESTKLIIFNFEGMEYMNSSGIGLLVTLLIRAQRNGQQLLAFGLKDHFKKVFELTRLNQAIRVYDSEEEAIAQSISANRSS